MAPPSSSSSANTTSVQVAVRIRPMNGHDSATIPTRFQRTVVHGATPTSVLIDPSNAPPPSHSLASGASSSPSASAANNPLAKKQTFTFDQVHSPETTQHALYEATAAPLVLRFLQGFNCTILAYGQTSSGKTYSMTGVDLDADPSDPNNGMGIIPRAVSNIFAAAQQLKQDRGNTWKYSIKGSFVELYNEDLIDLLGLEDVTGAKPQVQIREDKDGTILMGGLREIAVKNAPEVMSLIKQGSAIRRTNETDMNAQSSRSHAIFSLTLTQKKYTGSSMGPSTPAKSGRSSPLPPGTGPSPSRLARPASVYGTPASRVGSPTFGRPGTPSFATAMSRGGSLRPASAMALGRPASPDAMSPTEDNSPGDWVTVTSKFHFVDLAGSERLKRTAAIGDRIKEGISINGGLLALGNVISALGDPSRSRALNPNGTGSIHIPYRDSKLTRLLQDSLGGNAHTFMIACVSPAEWNALETVNTLKYANRARNIKNRAEVKEKEEGWEDIEWLQAMVTKLRKEAKALKEGGGGVGGLSTVGEESEIASSVAHSKMLQKYNQLQGLHLELRQRFVEAQEELRRTRAEVENSKERRTSTSSPTGAASIKRYEEIVAPVIEQYEKTIAAMEAELKLNRTALMHTNEMYEEQENELESLKERHSATEAYVEELRVRVSKLLERETSTESYVRDLEEKIRTYAESSSTSSDILNDLRQELARYQERDTSTAAYITQLEARLAKSDSDFSSLQGVVERLEAEAERKDDEIQKLEVKLEELIKGVQEKSDDMEEWKKSLDEREKRLGELEKRLEEWEKVRVEAAEERERLGSVVGGVERAKRSLEEEMAKEGLGPLDATSSPYFTHSMEIDGLSISDIARSSRAPSEAGGDLPALGEVDEGDTPSTPIATAKTLAESPDAFLSVPLSPRAPLTDRPSSPTGSIGSSSTREQLLALQKTHSDTLADLSDITAKYRDALREVSGLSSQIAEIRAQVNQQQQAPSGSPSESNSDFEGLAPSPGPSPLGLSPVRLPPRTPPFGAVGFGGVAARRRGTNRTSGDASLLPPVPPLPPIAGPNALPTRRLFFRHAASADSLHSRSQSQSQPSQEPSSLSRSSMPGYISTNNTGGRGSWTGYESLLSPPLPPKSPRFSLNSVWPGSATRSAESMEKEIARLQEVLKDREAEIAELEKNLKVEASLRSPMRTSTPPQPSLKVNGVGSDHSKLSPKIEDQFANLRRSMEMEREHVVGNGEGSEDSLSRLNELMLAMAQKENSHKIVVDSLNEQLEKIRKQHDELTALSRNQAVNMSAELEALRSELHVSQEERASISVQLANLQNLENELVEARRLAVLEHTAEIQKLRQQHEDELAETRKERDSTIRQMTEEHEDAVQYAIAKARREAELVSGNQLEAKLAVVSAEHEDALNKLREEHEEELRKHETAVEAALAKAREGHERQVVRLRAEHDEALKTHAASTSDLIAKVKAEVSGDAAVTLQEREAALAKAQADHEATVQTLIQTHADQIKQHLSESQAALSKIQLEHDDEMSKVVLDHATAIQAKQAQADSALQAVRQEHEAAMSRVKAEHEAAVARQASEHETAISRMREEHASELRQAEIVRDVSTADSHTTAIERLQEEHAATLARREASAKEDLANANAETQRLLASHAEDHKVLVEKLTSEHTTALARLQEEKTTEIEKLSSQLAKAADEHSTSASSLQEQLRIAQQELVDSREKLLAEHHLAIGALKAEHQEAVTAAQASIIQAEESHRSALVELRTKHEQTLLSEKENHVAAVTDLEQAHSTERDTLRKARDLVSEELESQKLELAAIRVEQDTGRISRQAEQEDYQGRIATMEEHLASVTSERAEFAQQVEALKQELERVKVEHVQRVEEASKRESLVQELEQHRSAIAEIQNDLQRTKDEKDTLAAEKARQDATIKELQAQLAGAARASTHRRDGSGESGPSAPPASVTRLTLSRSNGLPPAKLPPLTPPPSVPPPPLPMTMPGYSQDMSVSSRSTAARDSSSSRNSNSRADSPIDGSTPSTSIAMSPVPATGSHFAAVDTKLTAFIDEQSKQIEEQEAMIRTLNKQLTHCESDLQAHMDLVATLEASLTDSERNLRKARQQSGELAKERDSYQTQLNGLRNQLQDSQKEVTNMRSSIIEEKVALEQRLDAERKAKDRAKAQLESRMEELAKRKSKFVCL